MQSSKHIGKIVKEHADAVETGKNAARRRKSKASGASAFTSVPKHRAFVPMVTIWGGLILALTIAVLPDQIIAQASRLTGVFLPMIVLRLSLALAFGIGGALLGYIVSKAMSNHAKLVDGDGVLVSAFKSRDVQPINPVYDLGSESLDAPIASQSDESEGDESEGEAAEFSEIASNTPEREPNLGELAQRGYDIEAPEEFAAEGENGWAFTRKHFKDALIESCEGATCEAAAGPEIAAQADAREPANAPTSEFARLKAEHVAPRQKKMGLDSVRQAKPRALNLEEFGALPGRNAVWVEQDNDAAPAQNAPVQNTHEPKASAQEQKPIPTSALEKLRQSPAENLSLVEMVERFACALHEHQAQERERAAQGEIAREAALAEALKALALFTEQGFDKSQHNSQHRSSSTSELGKTERELRGALARLQELRGAA